MREAILTACRSADVLLMAAAVSHFKIAHPAAQKMKKQGRKLILELVENADFLLELPDTFVKVRLPPASSGVVYHGSPISNSATRSEQ
jgi:phosphopantothenoylcysteine synthetase/decarboxylase